MTNPIINHDGTKEWYDDNGDLHRDDGPAIVRPNGEEAWFRHGKRHREGGPALSMLGTKMWYVDGKLHNMNGPSVIYTNGSKPSYYIDGIKYELNDWLIKTGKLHDKQFVIKHLLTELNELPRAKTKKKTAIEKLISTLDVLNENGIDWPELKVIRKSVELL